MSGWRGIFWGRDFERRIKMENFLVHSVFQTVTNLQADPTKPLLSVVTRVEALGPNAMFMTGGGLDRFKVGSSVKYLLGQLVMGTIVIDCSNASRHDAKFKGNSKGLGDSSGSGDRDRNKFGDWDTDRDRVGVGVGQKSGAHQRVQAWLEIMCPGLTRVRSPSTDQLTQGLLTEDEGLLRLSLAGLIGQGEGLTPSGDDFVAGILLSYVKGFQLTGQTSAFLARLPCLVEEVWWRTTTISQTMLWYAARGDGASYVVEMAQAMLQESGQVMEMATRLCAVGASSGRYLLAGVLVGSELFKTREHDKLGRNAGNTIKYLRRFGDTDGLVPKDTTG